MRKEKRLEYTQYRFPKSTNPAIEKVGTSIEDIPTFTSFIKKSRKKSVQFQTIISFCFLLGGFFNASMGFSVPRAVKTVVPSEKDVRQYGEENIGKKDDAFEQLFEVMPYFLSYS